VETTLDLGSGAAIAVRGKFDRLLEGDDGPIVADYKFSSKLERRMDSALMLKGQTLQVPLYRAMAGPHAKVELLGVHPDLDPASEEARPQFAGFADPQLEGSFRQTLRVLADLHRDGCYPFRSDKHCEWCDYQQACRRHHPPSVERAQQFADARAYHGLDDKSTKRPDV
jgi:hypothetical protein